MPTHHGARHFIPLRSPLLTLPDDIRRAIGSAIRVAPFAAALGLAIAFALPKHYLSTASFLAENQNIRTVPSPLGPLADSIVIPARVGGTQSPAFFADVIESRAILLPILSMSTTTGSSGDHQPLFERLQVAGPDGTEREYRGLAKLRSMLQVTTDVKTNVVTLRVDAPDPELAYQIAVALLTSVEQFADDVHRSRVKNERDWLEYRVAAAHYELQAGEDALERFLSSQRVTRSSPALVVRERRLRRAVEFAEQRFLELQRQLDQARLEESRDTPVITVLNKPDRPTDYYRPQRSLVVLVVIITGMLAGYGVSRGRSLLRQDATARDPGGR